MGEVEKTKGLHDALKVLDDAFLRGESCKIGLIKHLNDYKVPMANATAVLLRKKDWVQNDKDKKDGRMSYILWNGPRVSISMCIKLRKEVQEGRRKEKNERKLSVGKLDLQNEIENIEAEMTELQNKISEKQVIINYLKSKL